MKLVKFSDGRFGVRRFSWFGLCYVYLDLRDHAYWWWMRDFVDTYAKGTEQEAREAAARYRASMCRGAPIETL